MLNISREFKERVKMTDKNEINEKSLVEVFDVFDERFMEYGGPLSDLTDDLWYEVSKDDIKSIKKLCHIIENRAANRYLAIMLLRYNKIKHPDFLAALKDVILRFSYSLFDYESEYYFGGDDQDELLEYAKETLKELFPENSNPMFTDEEVKKEVIPRIMEWIEAPENLTDEEIMYQYNEMSYYVRHKTYVEDYKRNHVRAMAMLNEISNGKLEKMLIDMIEDNDREVLFLIRQLKTDQTDFVELLIKVFKSYIGGDEYHLDLIDTLVHIRDKKDIHTRLLDYYNDDLETIEIINDRFEYLNKRKY